MIKWIGCCFPSKKEDLVLKDKLEYKDNGEEEKNEDLKVQGTKSQTNEQNNFPDQQDNQKDENKELNDQNNNNVTDDNQNNDNNKKDEPMNLINSHRQISQNEIDEAPILLLEEEHSNQKSIFDNSEIRINAAGLMEGGRNEKDGVTIFGVEDQENSQFKADFYLKNTDRKNFPYIFAIYYQREVKKYFIKSYTGKGADNKLLFVKLGANYDLVLKQKETISAGNVIFQVTPIENNCISVLHLNKKDEQNKQIFNPENTKEVTIGRGSSCSYSFPKDKSFSRIQTTFSYDDNTKLWTVIDGSKTKSSTNGTWVFGTHSFEIKDQTLVEILTSKVKFTLKKNND